jgi:hypothetical protein
VEKKLDGIWRFYEDREKRWRWQCRTYNPEAIVDSEDSFERYSEAILDAIKHGFVLKGRRG